jgi:phosphatidylinositol-3-phosphatase
MKINKGNKMKAYKHINQSIGMDSNTFSTPQPRRFGRSTTSFGAMLGGVLLAAQVASANDGYGHDFSDRDRLRTVFVIALENHNLIQPNPTNSPEQILGNPAAPYINSLITPGNPNAAQVSFDTAYYNAGLGVHPSEPNYVWAEAGTDFGFHSDADPSPANGNTYYDQSIHLVGQLDSAGIPWKDYQEDVQLSASPTNSASGINGPTNIYNGSTQYSYAVKHNPMAFFADSAVKNVYPLPQLFEDLSNNTVGRYNWITPDQYNEAHSALNAGFTYRGVHYTGDQSAIAEADNFLSIVLPQIMASRAYKDNGAIVLWWDETEGGDDTNHALPEIVISPLAKGNAYASGVPMSHSSDLKTWEELFQLPDVNNFIPTNETAIIGIGYNNVATVTDLSDLFVPDAIRAPYLSVHPGYFSLLRGTDLISQDVRITNDGNGPAVAPLYLILDDLSANATLVDADGQTTNLPPVGSPYVQVDDHGDHFLLPGASRTVRLIFANPSGQSINYNGHAVSVTPAP